MVKKLKAIVLWTYVIRNLNYVRTVDTFYKKELQNKNQTEFRVEKVIFKKGDKLYAKWKGNDNWFNNWINKKDIAI